MPSFSTFLYGILLCMEFFVELFVMESWTLTISFFIFSHVLVVSVLGPFFGLLRKEIILILEVVAGLWFFVKDEWVIHCSFREWEHLRWHNFCNRSNFHKDFLSDIVIWYWVVWTSRQHCREGLWHQRNWRSYLIFSNFSILQCFIFWRHCWGLSWDTRVILVCWGSPFFRWCCFEGREFWDVGTRHLDFQFLWVPVDGGKSEWW